MAIFPTFIYLSTYPTSCAIKELVTGRTYVIIAGYVYTLLDQETLSLRKTGHRIAIIRCLSQHHQEFIYMYFILMSIHVLYHANVIIVQKFVNQLF